VVLCDELEVLLGHWVGSEGWWWIASAGFEESLARRLWLGLVGGRGVLAAEVFGGRTSRWTESPL
jgi:hypothetical protein